MLLTVFINTEKRTHTHTICKDGSICICSLKWNIVFEIEEDRHFAIKTLWQTTLR